MISILQLQEWEDYSAQTISTRLLSERVQPIRLADRLVQFVQKHQQDRCIKQLVFSATVIELWIKFSSCAVSRQLRPSLRVGTGRIMDGFMPLHYGHVRSRLPKLMSSRYHQWIRTHPDQRVRCADGPLEDSDPRRAGGSNLRVFLREVAPAGTKIARGFVHDTASLCELPLLTKNTQYIDIDNL